MSTDVAVETTDEPESGSPLSVYTFVIWLRDHASGPMTQNPEHAETCDMLTKCADALEHHAKASAYYKCAVLQRGDASQIPSSSLGVMRWWADQHDRWITDDGAINQNIYDVVKNEELRRRIAPMLKQLFPGCGTCEHCDWPWALVDSHTTPLTEGRGVFPLCEYCWRHLRAYGREDEIRRLYHQVREKHWEDMEPCLLDAALDQDFGLSGQITINSVHPDG